MGARGLIFPAFAALLLHCSSDCAEPCTESVALSCSAPNECTLDARPTTLFEVRDGVVLHVTTTLLPEHAELVVAGTRADYTAIDPLDIHVAIDGTEPATLADDRYGLSTPAPYRARISIWLKRGTSPDAWLSLSVRLIRSCKSGCA